MENLTDRALKFAKENQLYVDYGPSAGFPEYVFPKFTHTGFEAMENSGLGNYIAKTLIDSAHIGGLLSFHIGMALSKEPYANAARDKLYAFAEKVKAAAPEMKNLLDAALT